MRIFHKKANPGGVSGTFVHHSTITFSVNMKPVQKNNSIDLIMKYVQKTNNNTKMSDNFLMTYPADVQVNLGLEIIA